MKKRLLVYAGMAFVCLTVLAVGFGVMMISFAPERTTPQSLAALTDKLRVYDDTHIQKVTVSPLPSGSASICGEAETVTYGPAITTTPENSGLKSWSVRTLTMGENGLWIGYAKGDDPNGVGVSHYDGKLWRFCGQMPNVNSIALDEQGNPWVGTDGLLVGTIPAPQKSLMHFENGVWVDYTSKLRDYRVRSVTFYRGILYVSTPFGLVEFDGNEWTISLSADLTSVLANDSSINSIAFTHGEMWLGTDRRVIRILVDGSYQIFGGPALVDSPVLGGDKIRKITVSPSDDQVWIAADPGDLAVYSYSTNEWTRYAIPRTRGVNDVEFDSAGRPCVATTDYGSGGVYCLDNGVWKNLVGAPTYTIAFGCDGCVFPRDELFAGTANNALIVGKALPHR